MERKAGKRKKSVETGVRKNASIPVRVTEEEKAILIAKARRRGLGVSSWLVMLGLTAPDGPGET
jgi:hypothetical protein